MTKTSNWIDLKQLHVPRLRIILIAALGAALAIPAELSKAADSVVTIAADNVVAAKDIYIFNLLTPESRLLKQAESLKDVFVSPSPLPGRVRIFTGSEIAARIAAAGVRINPLELAIPDQVRVTRQTQPLNPNQIQERAKQEWLPTLPWKSVTLDRMEIPESVLLPPGAVTLAWGYPPLSDLCQPFYLKVEFSVDGAVVQRSFFRTQLSISQLVPVSVRSLTPADKITEDDVSWEERRIASTIHTPVKNVEYLDGRRLKTAIGAGEILLEDAFRVIPIIHRGDDVTLVIESGAIRLTASGKSLTAGSKGDRIRVVNPSSGKEMNATILDEKTVRVNF